MIISIHNNQMEVVDFMSNDIPGTLKYHDEEITAYLANGCISTFNLTVDKFQNGKLHPRLKYLNDQSYLSFVDDLGDTHLYTIRKIIERDYSIEIEAEDASLEMLNETIGKYEASTEMTFIEYCSSMELLKYTRVEIGLNEISSKKVKATFDATQTVLERFFELVSAFNAECEFKTILYPNGQLKYIQLNVYEPYSTSEPFKGVGDDRKDIQLHFGREVQGVTITTDKENLFNAIRLKDKDGNYVVAKKNHIWLDSDDLREAYMMRNTHTMYAPKSMMQYPSVSNVNSCDNWSLREFSTELTDYDEQIKYMHTMLKTYMYPIITYEVDMSYFHVFSNYKVRLGDTIYISDPNFLNGLLFQARVSEYKKNPSDTTQNTITLTNAVRITPKINEAMKQRMSELAAMVAQNLEGKIPTDIGTVNLIKHSTAHKGLRLAAGAETLQDSKHELTDWIKIEPSTVYTLSTYEDVNEADMYYSLAWYSTNNSDYSGWISRPTGTLISADLKGGKQYKSPANAAYAKVSYPINYSKVKFERGNVSTDYDKAPEDVQEDIDNKADQTLTQDQLNALTEKNNLIKAEMGAKASIDTVDKWIAAYENYVEANDEDKTKSEQALKEASERIVQMKYEVNDLKLVWEAIDRFMSFQNEGLIIGKKDGTAYAKFSDDRISLFSGSSEVMYISQGTINIANGIFTKTIQIGRFRFETHPADADMLVVRFLGG